jgi:hypothetical protein
MKKVFFILSGVFMRNEICTIQYKQGKFIRKILPVFTITLKDGYFRMSIQLISKKTAFSKAH